MGCFGTNTAPQCAFIRPFCESRVKWAHIQRKLAAQWVACTSVTLGEKQPCACSSSVEDWESRPLASTWSQHSRRPWCMRRGGLHGSTRRLHTFASTNLAYLFTNPTDHVQNSLTSADVSAGFQRWTTWHGARSNLAPEGGATCTKEWFLAVPRSQRMAKSDGGIPHWLSESHIIPEDSRHHSDQGQEIIVPLQAIRTTPRDTQSLARRLNASFTTRYGGTSGLRTGQTGRRICGHPTHKELRHQMRGRRDHPPGTCGRRHMEVTPRRHRGTTRGTSNNGGTTQDPRAQCTLAPQPSRRTDDGDRRRPTTSDVVRARQPAPLHYER